MRSALIALVCAAVIGCAAHGEGAQDGGPVQVVRRDADGAGLADGTGSREIVSSMLVRDLQPGETVRVLTYEHWRAIHAAMPEAEATLARIGWCESGFNPRAVGLAGERGAWQVHEASWPAYGPVPATLEAQAQHAARIMRDAGTGPWTTKGGCREWSAQ